MNDNFRHQGLRQKLVDIIREKSDNKIDEKVLNAINHVPRHVFIDSSFLEFAYEDKPFSIGHDQTISQPSTVAIQTHLLDIVPGQKVLEIGTGSGYQAAVLNALGAKVFTIERQRELFDKTQPFLKKYYPKIKCFLADGYKGLTSYQPFDRIIVTAAAPYVPEELKQQLVVGGKLIIPIDIIDQNRNKIQLMKLFVKIAEDEFEVSEHGYFNFVPMLSDITKFKSK
ncbi:MAG: protein-L-isoaspartate(D-aspartate) O-methyltransferase [Bacteroidales bacterium]|jgi:protein-L-isoaspartate(D-aspartate) O-methyltransferase|nr:protein-L-isoaspartate(D-aspartate) O-methyltransferase [Bacteroidales bacterium]